MSSSQLLINLLSVSHLSQLKFNFICGLFLKSKCLKSMLYSKTCLNALLRSYSILKRQKSVLKISMIKARHSSNQITGAKLMSLRDLERPRSPWAPNVYSIDRLMDSCCITHLVILIIVTTFFCLHFILFIHNLVYITIIHHHHHVIVIVHTP